jgi:hypothetical protein
MFSTVELLNAELKTIDLEIFSVSVMRGGDGGSLTRLMA